MPYQPLKNYLRTARRRAGLSQEEVAILLGTRSGDKVSRHETFVRVPSVAAIFAYEVIFNSSSRMLFAGAYEEVRRAIIGRTKELIAALSEKSRSARALRKLKHLQAIVAAEERSESLL